MTVNTFLDGAQQALFLPGHIIVLATLGLLVGQQSARRRWLLAAFVLGVIVGAMAIMARANLFWVQFNAVYATLTVALVAGLAVAIARPLPLVVLAPVLAAVAAVLEVESMPIPGPLGATMLSLAGSAVGIAIALIVFAVIADMGRAGWLRIGVRIAGSWAAAIAMLILALLVLG